MTLLATVGQPHAPPPKVISHRDHSKLGHRLTQEPTGQVKFKCNGCLEEGTGGDRHTCKPATSTSTRPATSKKEPRWCTLHPLLPKSTFQLRLAAPRSKERCSACGTRVQGIHYSCATNDLYLYLHPCCAMLPMEIKLSDELKFELREEVSHCCTKCKKGGGVRDYWFYRSTSKKVYLHVGCARNDFLVPSSSSTESHVDGNGGVSRYVKDTTLQKQGSGKAGRNIDPIFEIIKALASIIIAVLTGNPVLAITGAFDLGSNVIKLLKSR